MLSTMLSYAGSIHEWCISQPAARAHAAATRHTAAAPRTAVAAVFRRPAPPKATNETCLHDFESWAGSYVQGMGIDVTAPTASVSSANVNSQSFTAKGVELSADAVVGRLRFAGSFTPFRV